jgi:ABC-type branched-subunit amino acid transport system substrate-binding protein
MRRRGTKAVLFVLLAVLLLALPLTAACGTKKAAGAEIRIGMMGGQTGPAAESVVPMLEELEYIFGYINEVEGGINGMKISWRTMDNKGTPEGAILSYHELRDGFNPLFYIAVEDYYYLGIQEELIQDNAVLFTMSAIDPRAYLPPNQFFAVSLPLSDGLAGFVKWALSDWKGEGSPKIGVLYWELPSGQQYQMAQAWAAAQGVEFVPVQFPMVTMDLNPQMLQLRDAGVDYIWMMGVSGHAAMAIRDAYAAGIGGQIPICFNEYVEPDVLLELVGDGAQGFYSYRSESPYSEGSKAAKEYTDMRKWATGEEKQSDNRITMTLKSIITAAVTQTEKDVGCVNMDGAAFYNALNKLTDIDSRGNTGSLGFGPDKRVGISSIMMGQYTADSRVAVSDWIELPRTFEQKAQ